MRRLPGSNHRARFPQAEARRAYRALSSSVKPAGLLLVLFLIGSWLARAQARSVLLGIDVLERTQFAALKGKRVGLITNQASVDSAGRPTRLVLKHASGVRLVALFAPEHGISGEIGAGKHVSFLHDRLTGLPVHPLYGETRHPTRSMLAGLDALVFELQDIGCRSYTYISTMVEAMDAAGELGIPFFVLDRPNPLGGRRIEGPLVQPAWQSFVGRIPVPYVHGMTAGEIARMANRRGWVRHPCALQVVAMEGWRRDMVWEDTDLPWIRTSPNIPWATSPLYYVVTGFLGDLGADAGIGWSPYPFQYVSGRGLDAFALAQEIDRLGFAGVQAVPEGGHGGVVRLEINPRTSANLTALAIYLASRLNQASHPPLLRKASANGKEMLCKLYGSSSILTELNRHQSVRQIAAQWRGSERAFALARQPDLLYPDLPPAERGPHYPRATPVSAGDE
ncbi:exo-beta-N-acetylmuramidase NamZ domain-containing protein [Methylacidimicrobium sp. B4]|uniref:exo-beta-N-acetylmuramidase NamZ family protein n=1 Tax=Methylacidimicrobium sp. B4 TaxID=2796139 RepID=UPI001A8F4C80|nr:DUF1343 domain-containing protein [Methylacidimicrobium sp. B4]QSR84598.1 DUF1343 domain-containing protein [Methylacidimicrobium sp. B4]